MCQVLIFHDGWVFILPKLDFGVGPPGVRHKLYVLQEILL